MRSLADRKSFGKIAKQGVVLSFVREAGTEILLFPSSMVVARLLTPAEFGIAAAALFFTQLAAKLSELGFNAALVRSRIISPVHLSTVFVINLSVGAVSFLALTLISPWVARFYGVPETGQILPVAALSFLIAPIGAIPSAILSRELRYRETTLIDWYQGLTFAGLAMILAWFGFSFWSLVYAKVGSVIVQTVSRVWYARWRPSVAFSSEALGEVLSFAAGMHVKRLLDHTTQNLDNLVVGKLMGMTALGLYDKAYSTMNRVLARLNTGGPGVMFRIFALIHEDPARFRRAYSKVIMSATLVGFPVFAVLIAMAPRVLSVLFGHQWLEATMPFRILCVAGALKLLNTYASAATQAVGRVWAEVCRQLAFMVILLGTLILLRGWGPTGAAVAVLAATSVMTVLMHRLLREVTHLTWGELLRPQFPALLCGLGTFTAVLLVESAFDLLHPGPAGWLMMLCQGLAAGSFYIVFLLFAPMRDLRSLVREVVIDLAPGALKQHRWTRAYLKLEAEHATPTASV